MRAAARLLVQQSSQCLLQIAPPLGGGEPALEQHGPELVDERRAFAHEPVARSMQRLHVELLGRLQLDKAHGRPGRGLGDRFCIAVVVLLRLDVWANILRRHQPHLVAHVAEQTPEVVCAAAGLHGHDTRRQPGGELDHAVAVHAPAQHDPARTIQPDHAAGCSFPSRSREPQSPYPPSCPPAPAIWCRLGGAGRPIKLGLRRG